MSDPHPKRCHFYGRRQGKPFSQRQKSLFETLLPQVVLNEQRLTHMESAAERHLEIGFGAGEHLKHTLQTYPPAHFLGVEPFKDGIVKMLSAIDEAPTLQERLTLSSAPIQTLWPQLPNAFFHRICILFPDPWPKKRQQKRRVVNSDTIAQCARLLAPEGRLVLASDDVDYVLAMLQMLQAQEALVYAEGVQNDDPATWPAWPDAWPLTRYAQRGLRLGHPLGYLVWKKT